jgi:photosystem II stability/assembly factor-like uncharacterized protein
MSPSPFITGVRLRLCTAALGPLLIVVGLLLAGAAPASASWYLGGGWGWMVPIDSPVAYDCNGVAFADVTHGWIVGDQLNLTTTTYEGRISATADGGATWVAQDPGVTTDLTAVACADAERCWAVGGDGLVLATTNGGEDWVAQTSGTTSDLKDVCFVSATQGWAVGSGGVVLATTDGGASWSADVVGGNDDLAAVSFPDTSHGWVVTRGGSIWATADGGLTWVSQASGVSSGFSDVAFADADHGWATIWNAVYRTTDGGATWTVRRVGRIDDYPDAIACVDATHVWAVGGTEEEPWGTMIWATKDGGRTWKEQTGGYSESQGLADVSFVDRDHGWAVGESGQICATATGGRPVLVMRLAGLKHHKLSLGARVTVKGKVLRPLPANGRVKVSLVRRVGDHYVDVKKRSVRLTSQGSFRWSCRPSRRGAYEIKTTISATADHPMVTDWDSFKVR